MQWWSRVIKEVPATKEECQVPVRQLVNWWPGQGADMPLEESEGDVRERAAVILARARQEAEALRRAAQEEVALLKRQAWEEGYQAGREEGRREGFQAGAAEAEALREEAEHYRQRARQLLKEARRAYRDTIKAAQEQILDLALEIAAKIVGKQVELNPDIVLDIARRAIHEVAEGQFYIIYAAPPDAEFLRQHREELLKEVAAGARLQVVADEELKSGGCRVETESGFVDATIDTQLETVKRVLKRGGKE
jgi:flagellar assembly protein FliH